MRIFAIGDVHLPGGPRRKSMDRFGEEWRDHPRRIAENWRAQAREDDVLLLVGDLSWAMTLEEAAEDIAWIRSLPGRKVVLRGNHDYWWKGITKVRRAFGEGVVALHADHVVIDGVAIVGTRGWQCPGDIGSDDLFVGGAAPPYTAQDEKIYRREVQRLERALEGLARTGESYRHLFVALHYPPMSFDRGASGFTEAIDKAGADLCVHGHLHGEAFHRLAFEGERNGCLYHLVSADAVRMRPRLLYDSEADPPVRPPPAIDTTVGC